MAFVCPIDTTIPLSESSLTHARFSCISGAIVVCLTSGYSSKNAASPGTMCSPACAPFFAGLMNGPSALMPTARAPAQSGASPSAISFRIAANAVRSSAFETVIVVGKNAVTPFFATPPAMTTSPS